MSTDSVRRSARLAGRSTSTSSEPVELPLTPRKTPRGRKKNLEVLEDVSEEIVLSDSPKISASDDATKEKLPTTPRKTPRGRKMNLEDVSEVSDSSNISASSGVTKEKLPRTPQKTPRGRKKNLEVLEDVSEEIVLSDSPKISASDDATKEKLPTTPRKTPRGRKKNPEVVENVSEEIVLSDNPRISTSDDATEQESSSKLKKTPRSKKKELEVLEDETGLLDNPKILTSDDAAEQELSSKKTPRSKKKELEVLEDEIVLSDNSRISTSDEDTEQKYEFVDFTVDVAPVSLSQPEDSVEPSVVESDSPEEIVVEESISRRTRRSSALSIGKTMASVKTPQKKSQTKSTAEKNIDKEKEESPAYIDETNVQDEIRRRKSDLIDLDDDVVFVDESCEQITPKKAETNGISPKKAPESSPKKTASVSATSPKKTPESLPKKTANVSATSPKKTSDILDDDDVVFVDESCEQITPKKAETNRMSPKKTPESSPKKMTSVSATSPKKTNEIASPLKASAENSPKNLSKIVQFSPKKTGAAQSSPKKNTPNKTAESAKSSPQKNSEIEKVSQAADLSESAGETESHEKSSQLKKKRLSTNGTKSIWIQDPMNDSQFDLEPMEIDTSLNTSNRRRISSIVGEQSSESDADDEITSSNKEQEDSSSDVPVVQNVNEKDSGSGTNGVVSTPIANIRKRKSLENKSVELTEVSDAKTLFKQRGTKEEVMLKTIAQFYSDSNKLELFETGLPDDLVIKDDIETIWQQLAIQNASFLKGVKKSNKLLDEDLDFESKTEKQVVDEPLFSDDSENELIEDENDEEEEEEDADLFNLKDEDLMNLDAQLKKLDESDDEELPKKKKKLEKSDEGQRKGKKSAADDKFFSLEEMERHQDIDDVAITDESDDESDTAADYQYKDFFGGNDSTDTKTDTKKKVKFAKESDDEEEDDDESGDSDNEPVLFGEKPKEKVLSTHEIVRNKLEAAIEKIQQENLNPRSWELSGEVTAEARERESLLEKYIEVDFRQRQPPINGQEKAQKIQSVCLRRLKDKLFDDVERKYREDDTVQPYRNLTIDMNERKTLMEVYEDRFKAAQMGDADTDDMDPMIKDVQEKMTKLFAKLDALTHLQYAPGRVTEEIQIVKNMPSMRAEEVGPMATTAPDESVLAPEEIARHIKAAPIAKDERTKTDKKRELRKKKHKQSDMAKAGKMPKMGKDKELEEAAEKAKKSSKKVKKIDFFNQLQQKTVQDKQKQSGVAPKRKLDKSETAAKYKG